LNGGQIPNPNVVRVAPSTGYHRVEGNRRASCNGPVSDLTPPKSLASRFATFSSLYGGGVCTGAARVHGRHAGAVANFLHHGALADRAAGRGQVGTSTHPLNHMHRRWRGEDGEEGCRPQRYTAMKKLRIVILRFGTRDRNWSLNDGQIQNPSARL
jgi:hypothetical protein